MLKAYPKVNFIGHAQTWWGNISAGLDQLDLYPKGPVKPGGLTDKLLGDYANMYADLSAGSGLNAITRDQEFYRGFIARHSAKLLWGSDCDCHDGKGGGIRSGFCLAEQSLALLRKLAPDARDLSKDHLRQCGEVTKAEARPSPWLLFGRARLWPVGPKAVKQVSGDRRTLAASLQREADRASPLARVDEFLETFETLS